MVVEEVLGGDDEVQIWSRGDIANDEQGGDDKVAGGCDIKQMLLLRDK